MKQSTHSEGSATLKTRKLTVLSGAKGPVPVGRRNSDGTGIYPTKEWNLKKGTRIKVSALNSFFQNGVKVGYFFNYLGYNCYADAESFSGDGNK